MQARYFIFFRFLFSLTPLIWAAIYEKAFSASSIPLFVPIFFNAQPSVMSKHPGTTTGIGALCLLLILLIWIDYFNQRRVDRADTVAAAVQRNANLAVALEQFTIRTIHNAEALLQEVQEEYSREGAAANINGLLYANTIIRDFINEGFLVDENGWLVQQQDHARKMVRFRSRDSFRYHLQHNNPALYISKPAKAEDTGQPVISISRRLNKKDGSFGGMAVLQVNPRIFTSFYAGANLRPHDIISLIAPDGTTYARRTGNRESSGESIVASPLFRHVAQNPDSFYRAKDVIRGIPTYFSYRQFRDYPIIATVGTAEQDMLQAYHKREQRNMVSALVLSLLLILFSGLVIRTLLHRKVLSQKQLEDEHRYQRRVTQEVIGVQEKERAMIGRELHDNVNQVLTTVKLYLETAHCRTGEPLLLDSMALVQSSINEIRNLSHSLSAPTLGTRSLVDAVAALTETVTASGCLQIAYDHSDYHTHLPMEQKLAFYRILQEQINNIVRHAQATRVEVLLSQTSLQTTLCIRDNGKGFDPNSKSPGIGLNNIRVRTDMFQGQMHLESAPGKGCCLTVSLPIPASTTAAQPLTNEVLS